MEQQNKATWIWYPGDFEIWLGNIFNNRRTERGAMFPPFWKQDSHYVTVEFSKSFVLDKEEQITIATEGRFNLMLDGKLQFGMPETFTIPAGAHRLNLKVWNQATPPALYINGETIRTDGSWLATYEDKIWIDENGVAHGSGIYVPAASWHFDNPQTPPSQFSLEREEQTPTASEPVGEGTLYDFGKETFGYLKVHGLKGSVHVYYGESREEALDRDHCETLDIVCSSDAAGVSSKAFRYVYLEKDGDSDYSSVTMEYEYAPFEKSHSGSFRCSDDQLNKIWEVGAYTMDLTTREFFMDGIKRDRWTWSGDAIQSYLMNYYLRFDSECVKRTIRQLRGKDPVTAHVNTIMDYTFYWFKSVLDYYQFTGDIAFVRELYPRMRTLMDYCLGRTNPEGMMEGQPDDWIFVDWVDFPMHKRGILAFEQILYYQSLQTMSLCARLLHDHPLENPPQGSITLDEYERDADLYGNRAAAVRTKLKTVFWHPERHAYMHAVEDGKLNEQITKFPNMFAVLYGIADDEERQQILHHVMLNPSVPSITTPYMRFYELETLCMMGMQEKVLSEIRTYWGGMLREGATTFWEKYNPEEHGTQHLAMYGRPYGKSLCHAWGASPVYLLGRYYLGVEPVKPGYEEFAIRPVLGDLEWMEGSVPTPRGMIYVYMDHSQVKVMATAGSGYLYVGDKKIRVEANQKVRVEIEK